MDYSRPKQNLKGVVLALGMVCAASNAFAVSLEAPAGERGNFTPPTMAVQQKVTVTGTVSDAAGPLIGATIKVKGSSTGVVADMDGRFSIQANPSDVLEISYIGYVTQEVTVGNKTRLTIKLEEEKHNLNEVVVIGYGTQRREAVTGSVANISGSELNQIAATNAAQALQGRVAGVLMTQTSSKPGAEMQIRIRGQRSLNASNDPLIVLDGIPFMGKLSDINPGDIKSMDILKDASATAIYGSRGANGVILITTVKGMEGTAAKVSYNAYVGFKTIFQMFPLMNGKDYSEMRKYAQWNTGGYQNSVDESDDMNTDWQDLFYRTGISHSHDVSVAGGTNGGSYSFGASYYHDEAVVPTQGYDRVSIRGNFDQSVGKYFRFGLSTNTNYHETTGQNINMYSVLSQSPLINPYDADGNMKERVRMPADDIYLVTKDVIESHKDNWLNEEKGLGTYNTMFAEVKCPWIEGLSYRVNVGLNYRSSKQGVFTGTGVGSSNADNPNSASVQQDVTKNWVVENLLTYDRTFADKHHVNFTGLYSAEQTTFERTYMSGQSIPAEYFQYYNIGAATQNLAVDPSKQNYWQSGLMSWMGRIMYTYDNKYMISAAVRSDGSSRLAKGHQWHTYPAVSAGWNISRESFLKDVKWIDNIKLRVGYGETSNQSIDPYSTLGALSTRPYNFGSSNFNQGYYVASLPNKDLGWEYSSTWNFGVDFSFFSGRLSGTMEYYIQNTKDLLLSVSLPSTSGARSYMANVGKTRNTGFEFSLNGVILDNKNGWTWDAGINFYFNRNELVALASGAKQDINNRWFVGHPIDVIYDYKKIGLWQEGDPYLNILEPGGNVGMIKVEYTGDYNADGTPTRQINTDDRQIMDMEPDLVGGFNTNVYYKGFDFSLIGAFQIGGTLISALHSNIGYLNSLDGRRGQIDVDYWTETNTDAKYPRPGGVSSSNNPKYGSTLGYFDAGYLKVRAITLGYDFARFKAVKDFGISKLRAYFTVQNPFVLFSPFTNECGLDPETNSITNDGITAVSMEGYTGAHTLPIVGYNTPATRNFLFGINLTF